MPAPTDPPTIAALPESPSRGMSGAEFSAKAEAWVAALPGFGGDIGDVAAWMKTTATSTAEAAGTATTKAQEATDAAGTATTKAQEATDAANTATSKAQDATDAAGTATTKAQEATDAASDALAFRNQAEAFRDEAQQIANFDPSEYQTRNEKNQAGGYAGLDAGGKLNVDQLPVLNKSTVGLDQVDNTSDADKPVSTAQQLALDGKANISHSHTISQLPVASQGEAEAGTATDKVMTPQRVAQAIAALVPTQGAIGSLVVASTTDFPGGADKTFAVGDTVTGSSLIVANNVVAGSARSSLSASETDYMIVLAADSVSLGYSGTWRALARIGRGSSATDYPIGLFQRVA